MNIECTIMGKQVLILKLQGYEATRRCYSITVYLCRALISICMHIPVWGHIKMSPFQRFWGRDTCYSQAVNYTCIIRTVFIILRNTRFYYCTSWEICMSNTHSMTGLLHIRNTRSYCCTSMWVMHELHTFMAFFKSFVIQ